MGSIGGRDVGLEAAILDGTGDGIIQLDELLVIEWINAAACGMFACERHEVIGHRVEVLYPASIRLADQITRAAESGSRLEVRAARGGNPCRMTELTVRASEIAGRPVYVAVVRDITERLLTQRYLVEGTEANLNRVGRDLHDSLGQLLTGIAFIMKGMERQLPSAEAAKAAYVVELTNEAIRSTRQMVSGLSPATFEGRTLRAALDELVKRCSNLFAVPCSFRCDAAHDPQSATVRRQLYFIAREAITNAVRHGQPSRVDVSLSTDAEGQVLSVIDDGIGFDGRASSASGMGLKIMQHRAHLIGGDLEIQRMPGGGTGVRCRWSDSDLLA